MVMKTPDIVIIRLPVVNLEFQDFRATEAGVFIRMDDPDLKEMARMRLFSPVQYMGMRYGTQSRYDNQMLGPIDVQFDQSEPVDYHTRPGSDIGLFSSPSLFQAVQYPAVQVCK